MGRGTWLAANQFEAGDINHLHPGANDRSFVQNQKNLFASSLNATCPFFLNFWGLQLFDRFFGLEFFCLKLWSHCWPRQSPVILPRRRSYCVALEQWLWFYFAAANSNIGFWRRNEVSDEPHVFEQYCHSFKGISVFFLGIVEISTAK